MGPLEAETCRRLACDGAVTRVVVSRHRTDHLPDSSHDPGGEERAAVSTPQGTPRLATRDPTGQKEGLAGRLRMAMALLPPVLGGAPAQPLEVGRTSRVVTPPNAPPWPSATAAVASLGCDRPPAWCEAHHLRHWLHGGPTDLENLALLCRAHHRAVHEGGWRLVRRPDGRLTGTPPLEAELGESMGPISLSHRAGCVHGAPATRPRCSSAPRSPSRSASSAGSRAASATLPTPA